MNNSFAFQFTLFVASHLFSELFWQAPNCVPILHTPWLVDLFVCVPSVLLKFWYIARFCLFAFATPESQHNQHFALVLYLVFLSGFQLKPGLEPNSYYSLGRDEGVGSLRAQILNFFQCTKAFKGLIWITISMPYWLLCIRKKLWRRWPARKRAELQLRDISNL